MEIRQLKYFLKVAETLNFSEASRKLYITQSTLSQQISHLEQEIGLPLFERNSHEVYLTEAGKELRPYAQNAVNSAEACVDHMNDLKEMLTGELNIGVTFSFSNIMSETLIAFLHAYPHVKLNIQYRTMQELMDGLKKRELDLVLAFKPLKNEKAVDSRAIFSNRLAAIVNVNHPLARLSSVKLSDLERYDLILPCKGLQARNAFDHMESLILAHLIPFAQPIDCRSASSLHAFRYPLASADGVCPLHRAGSSTHQLCVRYARRIY